jgi:hypothetical protein
MGHPVLPFTPLAMLVSSSLVVAGRSAKHSPQRAGLQHVLEDEDVVQVI